MIREQTPHEIWIVTFLLLGALVSYFVEPIICWSLVGFVIFIIIVQ